MGFRLIKTFRVAFVLACFLAIQEVAGTGDYGVSHPQDLLVGFVSVLLIGFLSVALPRWTKQDILPHGILDVLLACHAFSFILQFWYPDAALLLRSFAAIAAAAVLAHQTIISRSIRSTYVVLLVGVQSISGTILSLIPEMGPLLSRICLSAVVLLCLEVGGRIATALITAACQRQGWEPPKTAPPVLLWIHRLSAGSAVTLWSLGMPASILACIAGAVGLARILLLCPWRVHSIAGIGPVLAGLAFLSVGFLGIAIFPALEVSRPEVVVIHIWSVGGLGMMAIAVMTSITRKRNGISFQPAILATMAYGLMAVAALTRLSAFLFAGESQSILLVAKSSWILSFACCMVFVGFGGRLGRGWKVIGQSRKG